MVVGLGIGVVFLLGMVAAAGYALRVLPAGARVPLNPGAPEYSVWLSRWAGLGAWVGIGAVVFAAVSSLTLTGVSANWSPSFRAMALPAAMLVLLAAEAGAVITARKALDPVPPASAGDADPEPANAPEPAGAPDASASGG